MTMNHAVRFLLVEDNPDHAEIVRQTFDNRRLANRLEHVTTGEAALQYLRQENQFANSPQPDVVLLDINLPGMSGIEVLEAIKADPQLKKVPVVMLTTSTAERDRVAAYENYANSFVSKPVDFDRMTQVVEHLQYYWTICNAPVE